MSCATLLSSQIHALAKANKQNSVTDKQQAYQTGFFVCLSICLSVCLSLRLMAIDYPRNYLPSAVHPISIHFAPTSSGFAPFIFRPTGTSPHRQFAGDFSRGQNRPLLLQPSRELEWRGQCIVMLCLTNFTTALSEHRLSVAYRGFGTSRAAYGLAFIHTALALSTLVITAQRGVAAASTTCMQAS